MIKYLRRQGRPQPPNPREPIPSVPPIGKADGAPLCYGGLRAASAPTKDCRIIYHVRNRCLVSPKIGLFYHTLMDRSGFWNGIVIQKGTTEMIFRDNTG